MSSYEFWRKKMNFKAIQVVSMAVSTMLEDIQWIQCGDEKSHIPLIEESEDVRKLELLLDVLETLTRLMDTRIAYLNTDGQLIREWVEKILEIGTRYQKELEILNNLERKLEQD